MWTSYSARHAAQLIGLTESAVRSCIRDGLVGTPGTVPAQLSFLYYLLRPLRLLWAYGWGRLQRPA